MERLVSTGEDASATGRSPERRREEEDEADGRDPPVSVCVRGEGSARSPRGPSARAGLGRSQAGRPRDQGVFLFPFLFKNAESLKLCNKSCVDSKIIEIFVELP